MCTVRFGRLGGGGGGLLKECYTPLSIPHLPTPVHTLLPKCILGYTPPADRMTDTRMWKRCLLANFVCGYRDGNEGKTKKFLSSLWQKNFTL